MWYDYIYKQCKSHQISRMTSYSILNGNIQVAVTNLLDELGEDTMRNGLVDTPQRFEKQLRECLSGYKSDPVDYVKLFDATDYKDLVLVADIAFSSLCEHHLLPFSGYVDVAYVPVDKLLGLSKFARIIDVFSKRLQVQERLTKEIADFLFLHLQPSLLVVTIRASHSCMTVRGVLRPESVTKTCVTLGDVVTNKYYMNNLQTILRK